jgi:hypothetical protein
MDGPPQVDSQQPLPVLQRGVNEVRPDENPGDVYKDVKPAELVLDLPLRWGQAPGLVKTNASIQETFRQKKGADLERSISVRKPWYGTWHRVCGKKSRFKT